MVYTLTVHLYANDKPDSIARIKAKLIEAARIYRKDKETVDWIVMQDVHDPRAFTIVERFENEGVCFVSFWYLRTGAELMGVMVLVPEVPPRESLLEDVRSLCYSASC
jgi:hypothetical protein